jgi:hypothetical protein
VYCGRSKVKGVPHHAKAGNINSCLLKEGPGKVCLGKWGVKGNGHELAAGRAGQLRALQ